MWFIIKLTSLIASLVYLNINENVGTGLYHNIAIVLIIGIVYILIRGLISVFSDRSARFIKPLTEHIANLTEKLKLH